MTGANNVVYAGTCTTLMGEPFTGVRACGGGSVSLDIFSGPFTRAYMDCSRTEELRDRWVVNTTCQAYLKPAGVNAFPTYFKLTDTTCDAPAGGVYLTGLREDVSTNCLTPPGYYGTVGGNVCASGAIAGNFNGKIDVATGGAWTVTGFAPSDTTCSAPVGSFAGASLPAECVPLSTDATKRLYIKSAPAYVVEPSATSTPQSASSTPSPSSMATATSTPSSTPSLSIVPSPVPRNATRRAFLSGASCAGVANQTQTYNSSDCTTSGNLTGAISYACNDAGSGVIITGWVNRTACGGAAE